MLAEDLSLGLFSDSSTELTPAPLHVKAFTQLLKTEEDQGVLTVTDIYGSTWRPRKPNILWNHKKRVLESILSLKQEGDKPNTEIFWHQWTLFNMRFQGPFHTDYCVAKAHLYTTFVCSHWTKQRQRKGGSELQGNSPHSPHLWRVHRRRGGISVHDSHSERTARMG